MLSKQQEGTKLMSTFPHEASGVEVEGDVGFVAQVEKNGPWATIGITAPVVLANKVALWKGLGRGPGKVVKRCVADV